VAALDGTTRVESVVGQGSTFSFTLPVDEAVAAKERLNPEFTAS
jgi:signal transduction histidine kinase